MPSPESIVVTALRFDELARRYCTFIETMETMPSEERVVEAVRLLSALVGAAIGLPQNVDVTEADVAGVAAPAIDLGIHDFYFEVFDPFEEAELVVSSVANDLGDIYVDLREGIDLLKDGNPSDALWAWRSSYATHWGDHAVDALRALHRIATDRGRDISQPPSA